MPHDVHNWTSEPFSIDSDQTRAWVITAEADMIIALYTAAAVIMALGSLYFAWRNRDFRKFLAGAFFVSSGTLFYLYLADVSVPLLGTPFVETPHALQIHL